MKGNRNLFYVLLLAALFIATRGIPLSAKSHDLCEDVCTASTGCNDRCYIDEMEFENGNSISCLDYGTYDPDQLCAGDGLCGITQGEDCSNSDGDCGPCLTTPTCGSNGCELGENCQNCPTDCGSCFSATSCNNNGKCDIGEDKTCNDCQKTGFCSTNSDCPTIQGNTYVCINDTCVIQDLPWVTNTCSTNDDCTWPDVCTDVPASYHGSTYVCPGNATHCKVCIPTWVR